jgi:hypothetical protein
VTPLRQSHDGRDNRIMFRGGPYGGDTPTALERERVNGPFPEKGPDEGYLMGARNVEPVNGGGDWICTKPDHWMFAGTAMKAGDRIPGLIGWEYHGNPPADIPGLVIHDPEKLIYLTQTTLSLDDANIVIGALKQAFPKLHEPPSSDICYATTNRQTAVRAIAPEAGFVLVVGSKNSSNSVRLTEIAMNDGTPSRLIDDAAELDPAWFAGVESVLVTSGASVPEDLVHGVIEALIERFGGEVEQRDVYDERVEFGLPGTLRELMRGRGLDPDTRRIRIDREADTSAWLARKHIPNHTVQVTLRASEGAPRQAGH